MARYMIQASHDASHDDCIQLRQSLLQAGAHFVTHAEWGCADGDHTAWLIVDAECDRDAHLVVPPAMRETARVTRLNRFDLAGVMSFGQQPLEAGAAG